MTGSLGVVRGRPRVVIAGGGVGGLEAALALRALAGPHVGIDLVAPVGEFVYRALTVAEPFGYERALRIPLERVARSHDLAHVRDALAAVHPSSRQVELESGELVRYDALVIATGVRQEPWLDGSTCFAGQEGVAGVRHLLGRLEAGEIDTVAFAAPTDAWTLPAYELALLTSNWCAERDVVGTHLSVVTPEHQPLHVFGRAASQVVRDLLSDHGIRFMGGRTPERVADMRVDAAVSLPRLAAEAIAGVPSYGGFIAVDEFCRVRGLDHVYAVGDITDHPIKQGGLAAQQADVAAASIAQAFGAAVEPEPFRPVLRGLLLGGMSAAFLRRDAAGAEDAAFDALWWPPTKVAGRYLGPFLADAHGVGGAEPLTDRPSPHDQGAAARDRAEVRRLAIDLARAEASWGEYATALRWLQTVEWLDGALPPELAALKQDWQRRR